MAIRFISIGPSKSGKPCPKFTALYSCANALISVNIEVPKDSVLCEAVNFEREVFIQFY